jgi:hypothetical protein
MFCMFESIYKSGIDENSYVDIYYYYGTNKNVPCSRAFPKAIPMKFFPPPPLPPVKACVSVMVRN